MPLHLIELCNCIGQVNKTNVVFQTFPTMSLSMTKPFNKNNFSFGDALVTSDG